ncbi:MAG TPA: MAPEG family protein [Devosia sp.]|nr:MAPEG family protein [Devosia sp.]
MPLTDKLLILAVVLQVLLTLAILVWLSLERVPRVMRGEIAVKDIAIDRNAYPLRARLLSNSFDNQFQLPVLFYVAALLVLWSGGAGWVEVLLAWLFVALRYVHAAVHVTTNRVHRRFVVYAAGLVVLSLLWLWLVLRLVILAPSI